MVNGGSNIQPRSSYNERTPTIIVSRSHEGQVKQVAWQSFGNQTAIIKAGGAGEWIRMFLFCQISSSESVSSWKICETFGKTPNISLTFCPVKDMISSSSYNSSVSDRWKLRRPRKKWLWTVVHTDDCCSLHMAASSYLWRSQRPGVTQSPLAIFRQTGIQINLTTVRFREQLGWFTYQLGPERPSKGAKLTQAMSRFVAEILGAIVVVFWGLPV